MPAFEELVREYQGRVYRYLHRSCRNQADAEELTQVTFVKAWEGIGGYRGDASFRTWLFRIATNLCINRVTRRKRHVPLDESLPARTADEPEETYRRRVAAERIAAAVGQLPLDQRAVLLLYANEEMSYEEIARATGRTVASVNALMYRARMAVRAAMTRK
jgi:RNA polymerase sigma-70 factor (ECF subfamily)